MMLKAGNPLCINEAEEHPGDLLQRGKARKLGRGAGAGAGAVVTATAAATK